MSGSVRCRAPRWWSGVGRWGAFFACLGGLWLAKSCLDRKHDSESAAYQFQYQWYVRRYRYPPLAEDFYLQHVPGADPAEVAQRLGLDAHALDVPDGRQERRVAGESINWRLRGWTLSVVFHDRRLAGATLRPPPVPQPPDERAWRAVRLAWQGVALLAPLAWLAALLACRVESTGRRWGFAQAALAAAIATALAWRLAPGVPRWADDAQALAAALMVAVGAVALQRSRFDPESPRWLARCPACDYDLTGNVSGVCPECGRPTLGQALRRRAEALCATAGQLETMTACPSPSDRSDDGPQAILDGSARI